VPALLNSLGHPFDQERNDRHGEPRQHLARLNRTSKIPLPAEKQKAFEKK